MNDKNEQNLENVHDVKGNFPKCQQKKLFIKGKRKKIKKVYETLTMMLIKLEETSTTMGGINSLFMCLNEFTAN